MALIKHFSLPCIKCQVIKTSDYFPSDRFIHALLFISDQNVSKFSTRFHAVRQSKRSSNSCSLFTNQMFFYISAQFIVETRKKPEKVWSFAKPPLDPPPHPPVWHFYEKYKISMCFLAIFRPFLTLFKTPK